LPYYECVFIARQDVSAPQVDGLADAFTRVIEDQGGRIAKREHWGLRTLAYRIQKNRKGHYVLLNLDAPAPAVHEMERQMRINEDIVRYMTIRVDALEEGPSAILQSRAGRDDRPRRDDRGREDRGRSERGRFHGDEGAAAGGADDQSAGRRE
jgi:small subunit ribosomal protein S6